jgi:hypothetical protein
MEHVFITTSLNPTYEIQDESQNWAESEIQENATTLFGNMLYEFTQTLRANLSNKTEVYWLYNKDNASEKYIKLPNAKEVEEQGAVLFRELVKSSLPVLSKEIVTDWHSSTFLHIAFKSTSNEIWEEELLEISAQLGEYVQPDFYVYGSHPNCEGTIVTQGYSEGEFDSGIIHDFDLEYYSWESIGQMIPGITLEMFNEEYYK